jgi:hypothetical protein
MAVAQIGPLITLFETLAAAVGAGALLGSFAMGTVGIVLGWSRQELADRALTDGYVGGLVGVFVTLLDCLIRYGL